MTSSYSSDQENDINLLIINYLHEKYPEIADDFKRSARVTSNQPILSPNALKEIITNGQWDLLIDRLNSFKLSQNGINDDLINEVLFKIFERKILYLVGKGNHIEAICFLRSDIVNASQLSFPERIASLTKRIFQDNNSNLDQLTILKELTDLLKLLPGFTYSGDRLVELVSQAKSYQISKCPFHFHEEVNTSVWVDHKCRQNDTIILDPFQDLEYVKVLFSSSNDQFQNIFSDSETSEIAASTDSELLLIVNKDQNSIERREERISKMPSIWPHKIGKVPVYEHVYDKDDNIIQIKDLFSGSIDLTLEKDIGEILSLAFTFDKRFVILSSVKQITYMFNLETGQLVHSWIRMLCTFLLTSPDSNDFFLAVICDGVILQVSICPPFQVIKKIPSLNGDLNSKISSAYLDCERLLIGCNDSSLYYYSNWKEYPEPTRILRGHQCSKYRINAILSRSNRDIVISGSENGSIYIWNIESGRLIYEIPLHKKFSNDVIEVEGKINAFISCGDDGQIIEWKLK
jgi:WD40 repeat protein